MGWRAVDLGEDEACQMAMDMDVVYNQYGQRTPEERREVRPPIEVEMATWAERGSWTIGCASAGNGGDAYAGRTDTRRGSKPEI